MRSNLVHELKGVVDQTLRDVYATGFDQSRVDGILHQLELALKHQTADFGIALMQRLEPAWFNDIDPFDTLVWNELIETFQKRRASGGYLESLLQKYLLNDQTMTFTMEPSPSFGESMVKDERDRLSEKLSEAFGVTGNEKATVAHFVSQEKRLLMEQAKAPDQDLSSLPSLDVRDISRSIDRKQIRHSSLGDVQIQWREGNTNGLTYFRAIQRLDGLPNDLRKLVPLFTDSIMRLGTRNKSIDELEDLVKLKTGGVTASYYSCPLPSDTRSVSEGLSFSGQALDGNVSFMYELLQTFIQETDFDAPQAKERILQLIQSEASGATDVIANAGHSYARRYAEASQGLHGMLNEQTGGLTQIQQTVNIATSTPDLLNDIVDKLKAIQKIALCNSGSLRVAITCGQEATAANEGLLRHFLERLPSSSTEPLHTMTKPTGSYSPKTFFNLPFQVSYTAVALPTVPYTDQAGATLQILSELLTHRHLHHEIREKGGAYGGGAYARALSGIFGFYSYRDPNPQNTCKVIHGAGEFARDKAWTAQDLQEAKLSTFQSIDAPQSLSEEGMTRFLSGIDEDMEQRRREQLLDVTNTAVQEASQRFLVDQSGLTSLAILGPPQDWIQKRDGWTLKNMELGRLDQDGQAQGG